MIFQLLLEGFCEDTDETDHLVKWIKAPSQFAVELFMQAQGLAGVIEETPFDANEDGAFPVGFGDGLDVEINESGEVMRTDNEIDVTTWKEQHNWPSSERTSK